MNKNSEPLSDHPLFRALVLMGGGGLALGCGGLARTDPDPLGSAGSSGSVGASGSSGAPAEPGGAGPIVISVGGEPSTTPPALPCPTEQYQCSGTAQTLSCSIDVTQALETGNCICNYARPTSVKDCQANENFVCLGAYRGDRMPATTWDGTTHVQCACVASPSPPNYQNCLASCALAFPGANPEWWGCSLPNPCTYDGAGNCTATSGDVLRQDGIICGCAVIALK